MLQVKLPSEEQTLLWCRVVEMPRIERKHHIVKVSFPLTGFPRSRARFTIVPRSPHTDPHKVYLSYPIVRLSTLGYLLFHPGTYVRLARFFRNFANSRFHLCNTLRVEIVEDASSSWQDTFAHTGEFYILRLPPLCTRARGVYTYVIAARLQVVSSLGAGHTSNSSDARNSAARDQTPLCDCIVFKKKKKLFFLPLGERTIST